MFDKELILSEKNVFTFCFLHASMLLSPAKPIQTTEQLSELYLPQRQAKNCYVFLCCPYFDLCVRHALVMLFTLIVCLEQVLFAEPHLVKGYLGY